MKFLILIALICVAIVLVPSSVADVGDTIKKIGLTGQQQLPSISGQKPIQTELENLSQSLDDLNLWLIKLKELASLMDKTENYSNLNDDFETDEEIDRLADYIRKRLVAMADRMIEVLQRIVDRHRYGPPKKP